VIIIGWEVKGISLEQAVSRKDRTRIILFILTPLKLLDYKHLPCITFTGNVQ